MLVNKGKEAFSYVCFHVITVWRVVPYDVSLFFVCVSVGVVSGWGIRRMRGCRIYIYIYIYRVYI